MLGGRLVAVRGSCTAAAVCASALAIIGSVLPASTALAVTAATTPVFSAHAAFPQISFGATTQVAGSLAAAEAPVAGEPLVLQASPYPFHAFTTVAQGVTASDGTFVFADLAPDRNTRYRVVDANAPSVMSSAIAVLVDAPAVLRAQDRGPGRTRLTLVTRHPPGLRWSGVSVFWFVRARGSHVFQFVARTRTRERRPGVTFAAATVDPPARRFVFRVCLNPPGEAALGSPTTHRRCHARDFRVKHRGG